MDRAVDLTSYLPTTACVHIAENPACAWSETEWLLSDIDWQLRILVWHNTEDGHKGINPPAHRLPPGMQLPDASTTPDGDVPELIDADKYLEELEKRRKEVTRRDNESG